MIGVFIITSPIATPFQKVCETYFEAGIIFSISGESYCYIYRAKKPAIQSTFLRATIPLPVFVNIARKWLEAIVHQFTMSMAYTNQITQKHLHPWNIHNIHNVLSCWF